MRLVPFYKHLQRDASPFPSLPPCEDTIFIPSRGYRVEGVIWRAESSPHQTLILLAPWSWTSQPKNCEKQISVVYKQSSVWNFGTAAPTDSDNNINIQDICWNAQIISEKKQTIFRMFHEISFDLVIIWPYIKNLILGISSGSHTQYLNEPLSP